MALSLDMCSAFKFPISCKDTGHWIRTALTQHSFISTGLYHCNPISKWGPIHRFLGLGLQRTILGDTVQPQHSLAHLPPGLVCWYLIISPPLWPVYTTNRIIFLKCMEKLYYSIFCGSQRLNLWFDKPFIDCSHLKAGPFVFMAYYETGISCTGS